MKYIIGIFSALAMLLTFVLCLPKGECEAEYLRIHIRANSNSVDDQNVKYKVKEGVVEVLIPLLAEVESFEKAKEVMEANFSLIEQTANDILASEGFVYKAKASIDNEYFPTRAYDEFVLEEGYYDALILRLGSGVGDNWWCLVYPAFCFTSTEKSENVEYVSKIWEIIEKAF